MVHPNLAKTHGDLRFEGREGGLVEFSGKWLRFVRYPQLKHEDQSSDLAKYLDLAIVPTNSEYSTESRAVF
jgi:hypothetical protein